MIEKLKQHRLLITIVLISIGLFFFYLRIQPALTYAFSPLFDGNEYLEAYKFFKGHAVSYDVRFPFNGRILVPYLAALLPFEDPATNFLILNGLMMVLSILTLFFLWRSLDISSGHIMTGFFWLLIHWVGIIRYNIYDPVTVDVPLYFFQALLLFVIFRQRYFWLLLLAPLATVQKESFLGLLMVMLLYSFFQNYLGTSGYKSSWIIGLALVLSITAKLLVEHFFPPADPGRNSFIVVLFHMKETLLNPFRFVRWLVAVFMAYGPMLLLALWTSIRSGTLFRGNKYLVWLSLTYLFFSIFAGGDMTRIAFLGFPFIMTWILLKLEHVKGFLFKAAFIAGLPLMKLFSSIPDPALWGWDKFNNWFPEFANPVIILLWIVYGILCLVMFRTIEKKLSLLS